jgi:hypothetical protein
VCAGCLRALLKSNYMIANNQIILFLIILSITSTILAIYFGRTIARGPSTDTENNLSKTQVEKSETFSEPHVAIGVFSGFRFGFGFGLGASVALLFVSIFFGGLLVSFFGRMIVN